MSLIKIYTKKPCGYCDAAKIFCKEKGFDFKEYPLSQYEDEVRKISDDNNGWRTFPMILVGDKFIGGYTDMLELNESSKLKSLIEEAKESLQN